MTAFQPLPMRGLPPVFAPARASMKPGLVDLWCFFYEEHEEPELLAAYEALMTGDERARHRAFIFEQDRLLFLATRALVRTVLSQYAGVAPADFRFALGARGKPSIDLPVEARSLYFNLTNTRGLVACAVSTVYPDLGVDAEGLDRRSAAMDIAGRYFSDHELRALRGQPAPAQRERFFAYWTLKESYIKARGLGLGLPLDQFSFLLDEGPAIGVAFDPRLGDDARRWRFALLRASDRHLVAIGVDTGGAPLVLRAARFVPLRGVTAWAAFGGQSGSDLDTHT